jgi:hypothetical protein
VKTTIKRKKKKKKRQKGLVYFRRLPLSSPSPLSLTSWSENEISKCDFKSYLVSLTKYGHEQRPIIDELSQTPPRKRRRSLWVVWMERVFPIDRLASLKALLGRTWKFPFLNVF